MPSWKQEAIVNAHIVDRCQVKYQNDHGKCPNPLSHRPPLMACFHHFLLEVILYHHDSIVYGVGDPDGKSSQEY